jgi:hypothetical protein
VPHGTTMYACTFGTTTHGGEDDAATVSARERIQMQVRTLASRNPQSEQVYLNLDRGARRELADQSTAHNGCCSKSPSTASLPDGVHLLLAVTPCEASPARRRRTLTV